MNLTVTKLKIEKPGFRATISRGWFVVDGGKPIAGPYHTKPEAVTARRALKRNGVTMAAGTKREEQQTKETETTTRKTVEQPDSGSGQDREKPNAGDDVAADREDDDEKA
jgi:hypothetical protein